MEGMAVIPSRFISWKRAWNSIICRGREGKSRIGSTEERDRIKGR